MTVVTATYVMGKQRHRAGTLVKWTLLLATMLDGDINGSDDPHVKRYRTVNPRPDFFASAWSTMLRDPELNEPTPRASKLFRRKLRLLLTAF